MRERVSFEIQGFLLEGGRTGNEERAAETRTSATLAASEVEGKVRRDKKDPGRTKSQGESLGGAAEKKEL